ncbi:MAG: hemerythrin domain-containing protein [Gemmatimonadales bacterium]|nr:hemerythrin domain-containing protein [Gemmatimonadales bacterium]
MTDTIYDALRESHEIQRSLCRKLLRARHGDQRRDELFRQLRIELAAHAAAEERYLYAPILMDDMGLNPSRHALSEHHDIDECVEALAGASTDGGSWMARAKKLSEEVHHHLREEEQKFFQTSGKILSDAQKTRLAGQYRQDYARMLRTLADA